MDSSLRKLEMIDYNYFLHEIKSKDTSETGIHLCEILPSIWKEEYNRMINHKANIIRVKQFAFEFLFDFTSDPSLFTGESDTSGVEDRVIVAFGFSGPPEIPREKGRIQGWIGSTEVVLGKQRDKGHFIAHSIGGLADGEEINLFSQSRSLNRGWSEDGKIFRQMERYCAANPGTFLFHRPIYKNSTSRPAFLEFGLLKRDGTIWVEVFDNA